jgi:acyl carrier protein
MNAAQLRRGPRCRIVAAFNRPGTSMSDQTAAEHELAELLVESLNLEDTQPGDIDPEAALFNAGLGLDSIDALELALAISKRYGFQLRSDNEDNRQIFASLRALAAHVQQHKTS